MKKLFILAALPLAISTANAGVCNNGSLIGAYSLDISGIRNGNSAGVSGQATFYGNGGVSLTGIRFQNGGSATVVQGNGNYTVYSSCVSGGSIT